MVNRHDGMIVGRHQCCGSKYIESRILAQFGYGSRVMLSILKKKNENFFKEK